MKGNDGMALADRLLWLGDAPAVNRVEATGEIPADLLKAVEEALLAGETHYTVRAGLPELRRRLAQRLTQEGGPSYDSVDNVLITTGESEALFVALLGLAPGPGEILVASSRRCAHEALFHLMGLRAKSAAEITRPARETRLIYREWSSNQDTQAALIRLAVEHGLPDILNLEDALGCGDLAGRTRGEGEAGDWFPRFSHDRTIVVGNLGSLPGMSSFRVGYLMGPERLVARIRVWKQAFSICSPAPSQRAALIALAGDEE